MLLHLGGKVFDLGTTLAKLDATESFIEKVILVGLLLLLPLKSQTLSFLFLLKVSVERLRKHIISLIVIVLLGDLAIAQESSPDEGNLRLLSWLHLNIVDALNLGELEIVSKRRSKVVVQRFFQSCLVWLDWRHIHTDVIASERIEAAVDGLGAGARQVGVIARNWMVNGIVSIGSLAVRVNERTLKV